MKGTIHKCAEKLIIEKFGIEKWQDCLKSVGLSEYYTFMINEDVDEKTTMQLLQNATTILGITMEQLFDAFGEYWVHVYAPKMYPEYYEDIHSAKQFLLNIDKIHSEVTENIPNAHPPRFTYNSPDDNILEMKYNSSRGLVHLFISLAKGLASYYKEKVKIDLIDKDTVRFEFQS
jgi:hypothetical protein